MPRLMTVRPASRSSSHFCFCAGLAYSAKVRIGPKLPNWSTSELRGHTAATCSMAITASISVPPCPPSSAGIVMPIRPCRLISCATSNGKRGLWARASVSLARCACAKPRTDSAKSFCSSVKSKFIATLRSISFNAGPAHDRRPFRLLGRDVGGVGVGRARKHLGAERREALRHVRLGQRAAQRRIEPLDDPRRHAGGRDDAVVQLAVIPRQAGFGDGRKLIEQGGAGA